MANITYTLKRNARSQRIRILIIRNGEVLVTTPRWTPKFIIENFLKMHTTWIREKVELVRKQGIIPQKGSRKEYQEYKEKVLNFVKEKVKELNKQYNFSFGNITIRNQKTRWGSCSKKGNLNFNYRIFFLPPKLADYIIVHELCHLEEFNHSKKFWNLVAKEIPDFRSRKRQLKNNLF